MAQDIAAVRRVLRTLLDEPEKFTDDELGELADMAREMTKLAGKQFVDRLLAQKREVRS